MKITATSFAIAVAAPVGEDIRDIRGPIVETVSSPWWPYAVIAVGVLALGLAVRALVRRRRKPLSADVVALNELDAAREHLDLGDPHMFSMAVSDAVRVYVEDAFALHASKLTTEELLADLMRDASPVAGHRNELGTFLEFCDLAKYARWSLTRAQMMGMLASAQAFVRATATPTAEGGRP